MRAWVNEFIGFFQAMVQQHRERRCQSNYHYWRKERVKFGDKKSRLILNRCKHCGVNYTSWEDF